MTSASRSKKFDVLELIESELEVEEVSAVDVVQEVVEITADSGAARKHMANPKEKRYENIGDEDSEVGGNKRQIDTSGKRCEIGIRLGWQ